MKQRAFTLIELLVVIAIIAILAAILFPVFAQAKAAAKQAVSLSGLKQMSLGLQMYSGDADDYSVMYYGYVDPATGDGNLYHYNNTWVGRIYPYVKNKAIYFDKDFGEISDFTKFYQDPYFAGDTYSWAWITTFSINADGYAEQMWSGSCQSSSGMTEQPRSLSAIDSVADRLAVTPTRYGSNPNFAWMYFEAWEASWPYADAYATTWDPYQQVFDARKQYTGKFIGAFADGHAAKFDSGKFIKSYVNNPSANEANSYSDWCNAMTTRNLWPFWGQFWSPD